MSGTSIIAKFSMSLNVLEASLSNSLNQSDLSSHCLPLYFYSSEKSIKHAADDLSRQHFQMKFFFPLAIPGLTILHLVW